MTTKTGYVVVLSSGATERELGPDDVQQPDLPGDHGQTNEWRFETPADGSLEEFRHGEENIFFEQGTERSLLRRGPIDRVATDQSEGKTRLRGRDILARLDEDGPDIGEFVADGPAVDEVQRLWDNSDLDGTLIEPVPEIIRDDEVVVVADS